jgi:hypothetical protein
MKRIILFLILIMVFAAPSFADVAALASDKSVDFKTAKTADEKKTYLVELYQLVFEEHRAKGADRRAGKITEAEFRAYERDVFDPKISAIVKARAAQGLEAKSEAEAITKAEEDQVIKNQMKVSPRWPDADSKTSFKEN